MARGLVHERRFRNRSDAGRILARALDDEKHADAVVVGLARGGVEVAAQVARLLGVPLDAVAVRKVRHPWQPEYAIGAVTPAGGVYLPAREGLTDRQLTAALASAQAQADALDARLHAHRLPIGLAGRHALLADDGLATGATMVAAVRWARTCGAARVVAAAPVASIQSAAVLRHEADRFVCPLEVDDFGAVGAWYEDFGEVEATEVVRLLDEAAVRAASMER